MTTYEALPPWSWSRGDGPLATAIATWFSQEHNRTPLGRALEANPGVVTTNLDVNSAQSISDLISYVCLELHALRVAVEAIALELDGQIGRTN